jgi:hypothetical protein
MNIATRGRVSKSAESGSLLAEQEAEMYLQFAPYRVIYSLQAKEMTGIQSRNHVICSVKVHI